MGAKTSLRVALSGARGKTGSVVAVALAHAPGITLVGKLVRQGTALERGEYTDLSALIAEQKPEVLVDFTTFPASKTLALEALRAGVRSVIGTSGYTQADLEELREACRASKIGIVYAPNFSIGAILMMQFSKIAAPYFSHADIIETHHVGKRDAPSGTAIATARTIAAGGQMKHEPTELVRVDGARGAVIDGVGIHSVRTPGAIATQEVIFANDDEVLTIRHATTTRTAFVAGVIRAVHLAAHLDHFVDSLTESAP
jgi:4-hydroxy-tetrahydrodipicolinate reductase